MRNLVVVIGKQNSGKTSVSKFLTSELKANFCDTSDLGREILVSKGIITEEESHLQVKPPKLRNTLIEELTKIRKNDDFFFGLSAVNTLQATQSKWNVITGVYYWIDLYILARSFDNVVVVDVEREGKDLIFGDDLSITTDFVVNNNYKTLNRLGIACTQLAREVKNFTQKNRLNMGIEYKRRK